ncbi:hypothetical protein BGW41_005240 [Actinomortierella wolfii]|nr:hypothetical protein BGW41_005240 [Actinomortierella wolfii]
MSSLNKDLSSHDPLPPPVDFTLASPSVGLQLRALARKTLSYHRRQYKINTCCLVIWPIAMVVVTFVLSLIENSRSIDKTLDIRYCVNEADPFNDLQFAPDEPRTPFNQRYIKIVNNQLNTAWFPVNLNGGYPQPLPCIRWFGDQIPVKHPYENSTLPRQLEPHAMYTPSPAGTWFNLEQVLEKYPIPVADGGPPERNEFMRRYYQSSDYFKQIWQKVLISYPDHLKDAVGQFPSVTPNFSTPGDATWPPADPSIVYIAPNNTVSSLLGNIPVRYAKLESHEIGIDRIEDIYEPSKAYYATSKFFYKPDAASMDAAIFEMVKNAGNSYVYYPGRNQTETPEEFRGQPPFGGLTIESLDLGQLRLKMTMQMAATVSKGEDFYGKDRVTAGLRQLITMSQMTTSMMKHKFGSNYTITQGLRIMPYVWNAKVLPNTNLNDLSAGFFPFALSFLLPIFVSLLVQEKEDRHRMMMAMNGLRSFAYYLAHYIEFMSMQLILCLFFALAATAIKSEFIWRTNPGLLVVLFLVWSHTQIALAFFIASFFSRARKASLTVYFFVAVSCIAGSLTEVIFTDGVPAAWSIHPMFAFFRIIQIGIVHASLVNGLYPLSFEDFKSGQPVFTSLMIMLGESVIFMVLTGYLDAILPSEYGVRRPWHFPISMWFKSSSAVCDAEATVMADHTKFVAKHHGTGDNQRILVGADADVYAERDRVESGVYRPDETPLILHNLFHQYPNKVEPALRGISLGVPKNQVLGLLGPNGAGKSTMIHLLTGLYTPTSGTAFVAGADIRTDMTTVHSRIGVCPQHDILWNDLTIADHLLFYARLRGIPPSLEQQAVDYALANVSLTALRDRQVVGLSGGEKRRVSIAISLLGDNKVIFLDEPSTGLDPEVRRVIWDVVHRIKKGRTVILTTHSMEEADMLSDRICIMTLGRLRCVGSSLHLKELYGSGFRLNIYSKPGRLEEACQSVEEQLMRGKVFRRIDKFTNASTFEFQISTSSYQNDISDQEGGELSMFFHYLNQPEWFPAIEDWSISQATLEDVFIKVVTEGEDAIALPGIAQYTK